MVQIRPVTGTHLRTPRAAAIAGLLFAVLLILALALFLSSIPKNPLDPGAWLAAPLDRVVIAINLIPFAGIAFLWFIGVVRDRLAEAEDRLFATVFLGSGLLFLGMLFVAGAVFGAIVTVHVAKPELLINSPTFALARAFAYNLINVYAIKMAGVFMMITSTLAIRTGFVARWLAIPGLVMAAFLLFGSHAFDWSFAVFPAWVLLVSAYILIDNLQSMPSRPQDRP
ncbi:MAG: hypothetical protein KIT82_21855 [Bradyrhizobium sp.]|nr:hypothetical protein [Bradyrhizobium sp.]